MAACIQGDSAALACYHPAENKRVMGFTPSMRVLRLAHAADSCGVGTRTILAVATAVVLAACSSSPSPRVADANQPDSLNGADAEASDVIARYAASAPTGATQQLTVDGRQVWVTVGQSYTSALGNKCRRITLRGEGEGARVSAVCLHDGDWKTVLGL